MRRLAVLSMHTSPLVQPGTGDSGGMNVYVRELVSALAQAGVPCDVLTRADGPDLAPVVDVEPGFRVVHVEAGPRAPVPKEALADLVPAFTRGVVAAVTERGDVDAVHANYWLSGVAGHGAKHELGLPLVSTFHTLARVKAEGGDEEPAERSRAEAEVVACSDAILANGPEEAADLERHYGAPRDRIEIVPPGVDHAFFSPGDRDGARVALGLGIERVQGGPARISSLGGRGAAQHPVLCFVGRIQPLKGLDVAIRALAALDRPEAELVVVGGPSGSEGAAELARAHESVAALGLGERVRFVPPQPHHLLSTWYRAADVVVVPSRSESFGLVALEAAACGRPVVAADVGGLRTIVAPGVTGELVESHDPVAFATAIAGLLDDPVRAREFARAAAARARGYT
ncbi:MAG: glycosyltransferase, partial [Acidimicrobiia bacterium]|nr:glycosyltransferase [Acidimicrobiia bacterium]